MRMFLRSKQNGDGRVYVVDPNKPKQVTRKQLVEQYRLHMFVVFLFVCTLLFVSLGWYYKDLTRKEELHNQKIFLDQESRLLTVTGDTNLLKYQMLVGRNLPDWLKPLHCPELDASASRECLWKGNAVLRVRYEHPPAVDGKTWDHVHCYKVSWQTLRYRWVPDDCFELQQEVTHWYGPSNQSESVFPINGSFDFVPTPYHLSNGGVFSSVVELYWLNSRGVGILVNASDPVTVHWNTVLPNHVCVRSNYTGPLFGRSQRAAYLPSLNYTVCMGPDPVTTHLAMRSYARKPDDSAFVRRPSDVMFSYPQWSLSGLTSKADYSQSDVEGVLERFKNQSLDCDVLYLDGEWQRYQGDLTFDPQRFPAVSNLTDSLRNASCGLGIQLNPYFDYRSDSSFYDGVVHNHFVKDAGGNVPGLVRVRQGSAVAVLDVSSSQARAWFKGKVKALSGVVGGYSLLKSIGLSLGDEGWLPYKPTLFDDKVSFRQLRRLTAEMGADFAASFTIKAALPAKSATPGPASPSSSASGGSSSGSKAEAGGLVLSHTTGSQTSPAFIPIVAEVVQTADGGPSSSACLAGLIDKALTLGLLGYPYVMAGGPAFPLQPPPSPQQQQQQQDPTAELLIRWMQVAAFFPASVFTAGPWRYGEDVSSMLANLTKVRKEQVLPLLFSDELRNDVEMKGLPILRPTWWLDPSLAEKADLLHVSRKQFLLGNDLLVAPVLCAGQSRRTIYVPDGVWSDQLRGTLILGPKLMENYRVGLYEIPYFKRVPVYEEDHAEIP